MTKSNTKALPLKENIQLMMDERGLRVADVAKETKLTFNAINYILCGVTKNPSVEKIRKLADFFEVSVDSLMGINTIQSRKTPAPIAISSLKPNTGTPLPVLPWNDVKAWHSSKKNREKTDSQPLIFTEHNLSSDAFAVSITREALGVFSPNSIAIVEPNIPVKPENYVIASINKMKPCIRQVCKHDKDFYLNGAGENVRSEKLSLPNIIIGTIVEVRQPYVEI